MAITDHVAILLGHSLNVAKLNKNKTRSDFFAQVALPPAAAADVGALVSEVYPGVPLSSIQVNFKPNAQQDKPFVGVPPDWFILRLASQYAPELYAADGVTLIDNAIAKSKFFAGQRVRIASSAWAWKNEFGKAGASFNLHGVMDAGEGGERLQIGTSGVGSAFKSYAQVYVERTEEASPVVSTPASAHTAPDPNVHSVNVGVSGGPFSSNNPFAQSAAAGANPFAK